MPLIPTAPAAVASSMIFSTCLGSGGGHRTHPRSCIRVVPRNVLTEDCGVERAGHTQRATEGPAPLREVETAAGEMH